MSFVHQRRKPRRVGRLGIAAGRTRGRGLVDQWPLVGAPSGSREISGGGPCRPPTLGAGTG